ncbi:putative thiamine transport system permease protein [Rhodovulum imhoffii]|uniref:Putative thiamine transport system permease protein n=1 Tax=Rhodovulum imhoffii TaxID=365340 RepID=A0A2T5BR97_9RHOB|nr:ABC transporter permease subunit [Rhodovulum imhoffii]MBK5934421.1 ABC transporter permease [Rhodovulum imhoffii]PTN01767.1 putative thiamine transport system permease protein [Rhodovulum imhoffii]
MQLLRAAPALTLLILLGPVAAGLMGTLAPAFGVLPALGGTTPGLAPLRTLLAWPGLTEAVGLSISTGIAATILSLGVVTLFTAGWYGTRPMRWLTRLLAPLLAIPHAAAAFGLAFLVAPSGWLARVFSPWATGWDRPPDLLIVQDPLGLTMIAGLVVKEIPFLMLMTLAALPQAHPEKRLTIARALGHGRVSGWLKAVFPAVYTQIRLPVYAVLAYSLTVVDVAIILGPNTPPPLAVQVVRWMSDPDLSMRFPASAGAMLQLVLVLGALGLWRLGEHMIARLARPWAEAGPQHLPMRGAGLALAALGAGTVLAGLGVLGLWSVAGFWPFPDALPRSTEMAGWVRHGAALGTAAWETLRIATAATGAALGMALACLEAEHRFGLTPGTRSLWVLYLPLLIPQVAFLPGLQTLALITGAPEGGMVVLGHLVFVLPYVFLTLAAPWRAWDTRHATVAAALGAGPWRVFWTVRLPMLASPVLTAGAVGLAVSVGQYLPTLLIGGGRIQTLTTEAVALASGGDRRVIGVTALAQTALAVGGFALALAIPRLMWRNRRGLRGGR